MEICRHNDQIEISELDPQAPARTEYQLPSNVSSVPQQMEKNRSFAQNGSSTSNLNCGACFRAQPKPWLPIWNN